jgi:hypothetical protein
MAGGQKLVARSSTESELIGVYDVMPQIIWTGYFLKAQGLDVVESILYQDNMSSILLEKNGRRSSSKRTRHINIRYFFVKDRVESKEVRIVHCPTKEMVADYFTKPLQGALFYKLRDYIMNVDSSSEFHSSHRSVLKDEAQTESNDVDEAQTESNDVAKDAEAVSRAIRFEQGVEGTRTNGMGRSYKDVLIRRSGIVGE